MMLRYINYNRKSSESEDKQALSIISQEEFAQGLATREHISIEEVINEQKSAKNPHKRKGFISLLKKIRKGQCNAIICWKLDRLARNMVEGGEIIELLQQGKIQEIRTAEKVYTPNENAILLAVEFGSANQYSRDLSINVKRGLEKKAKMGIPGGIAPFGYLNNRHEEKGTRKWRKEPKRFGIVQVIFSKILEGKTSIRNVHQWILQEYHPTTVRRKKIGGKPLAESAFYRLIQNPVYAGFFYHAGIRYELHSSIPKVITEEQYWQIQRMLGTSFPQSRIKHEAAYVGVITSPKENTSGLILNFNYVVIVNINSVISTKHIVLNAKKPLLI